MTPAFPTLRSSDLHSAKSVLSHAQPDAPEDPTKRRSPNQPCMPPELGAALVALQDPTSGPTKPLVGAPSRRSEAWGNLDPRYLRSEEHTSELQSLMRISYAVLCLTNNNQQN